MFQMIHKENIVMNNNCFWSLIAIDAKRILIHLKYSDFTYMQQC